MTRRPVKVVHSRANSAMVWLLPAPAGATSTVVAAVAVSIMITASRCSAFSSVLSPLAARPARSLDQLRHGPFRGREDLFLDIEVGQGAVPLLVRRPVDAPAVRGPDAEAGHVGDVRGGDLDDLGAGPAADGQPGDLVDHRRAVDAPLQDRECPVHLEAELGHRPHRVVLLHLGHRDPRGPALGRVIQHGGCAARRAGGRRRPRPARARRTAPGLRAVRSALPRRRAAAPRWVRPRRCCPAMVRRAWALVRRVFCPACWCSSHSVRLLRRPAVHRLVLAGEPVQLAGDCDGAGAEQVLHVLADAADLGAVAVRPGHHHVAEGGELGFQDPVGDRGDGEPLVVQAARVQGPPFVVGAVGALDPVPDRHVHVQLRVPVARQVMQEQAGGQPGTVPPLPRVSRMVAGARVGGVLLEPGDGFAGGVHQRGLELVGAGVERGGAVLVAALAGLPGGDPVGGVQDRDALDRADGQVEVRHLVRVLGAFGGADLGQLGRAGVRMRCPVGRHRGGFAVRGRLGLAPLDQELPAGAGVLLVQALDDVRVDLARSARAR